MKIELDIEVQDIVECIKFYDSEYKEDFLIELIEEVLLTVDYAQRSLFLDSIRYKVKNDITHD